MTMTVAAPNAPKYAARMKRLEDAMSLRKPDRVPVAPVVVTYYANRIQGIPNRMVHYDLDLRNRVAREAAVRHSWDAAVSLTSVPLARPLERLGLNQILWPGGGLPDDRPFQYVEGEFLLQDEYDEMLSNPDVFAIKKLWPRISSKLGAAGAALAAPTLFYSNALFLPGFVGGALSAPGFRELLHAMTDVADEMAAAEAASAQLSAEMQQLGYPVLYGAIGMTAFDFVSDFLRGLRGTLLDMYQVPDRLLAAVEMYTPWTIEQTLSWAKAYGHPGVFLPLHRGAGGFMSNEQFAKFYWPSLKALLLALIEAGYVPMPLFEGDFTPRLEFLQELPRGKVVGHFDKVDRRRAKELIGDTMCFWGNVPSSLLCTATAREVKDDVRELIEIFGDNGGLIIDGTVGIPDEAKPENVFALMEAANEYGRYS